MNKKNKETSKYLSYILRHHPESMGLSLDKEGWAVISDLILLSNKESYNIDNDLLLSIVENSDKKRFMISEDGLHIRASQGHSTQKVSIEYSEKIPPEILYMVQPPDLHHQLEKRALFLKNVSMFILPRIKVQHTKLDNVTENLSF